jgi:hypothetical protein
LNPLAIRRGGGPSLVDFRTIDDDRGGRGHADLDSVSDRFEHDQANVAVNDDFFAFSTIENEHRNPPHCLSDHSRFQMGQDGRASPPIDIGKSIVAIIAHRNFRDSERAMVGPRTISSGRPARGNNEE